MAHAFRTAVESRDLDAAADLLAPDVQLHSPVAFRPFDGRESVMGVLTAITSVFEDFEYIDELESDDGTTALIFRARVGDKSVQGIDYLRHGDDGLITEFTVMLRPLSAIMAVGERMAPQVEGLAKA
ncbi:MAG: nuclear transport factor 2 family protein [Thermoleophilaceae bacterium]|nr:nuclear transport factor 2 family protein [Thermoleophilaceae bacterium]